MTREPGLRRSCIHGAHVGRGRWRWLAAPACKDVRGAHRDITYRNDQRAETEETYFGCKKELLHCSSFVNNSHS